MVQLEEMTSDSKSAGVRTLSTEELRAEVERLRMLSAAAQALATKERPQRMPGGDRPERNVTADDGGASEEEAPAG